MPSPLSVEHGESDVDVGTWLGVYKAATPGTAAGSNTTTFLLDDVPQPDVYLRILPEYGGASWVENKYLHGVPELLTEVSATSASYDLHAKLDLYESAKIPEYLVVLLYEQQIRWHVLVRDRYEQMPPGADGVWRSLSNIGEVLIQGRRAPILGRVCMDMTLVDVTTLENGCRRASVGERCPSCTCCCTQVWSVVSCTSVSSRRR